MSEGGNARGKANAEQVRALLCELSQQLLAWSWEGVADSAWPGALSS